MPLEREKFTVFLNTLDDQEPRELQTTIHHQDMMRAEQILVATGQGTDGKLTLVTAWNWAALSRMGEYTGPWERFRDVDCAGLEDAGKETVDPTQPDTPSG